MRCATESPPPPASSYEGRRATPRLRSTRWPRRLTWPERRFTTSSSPRRGCSRLSAIRWPSRAGLLSSRVLSSKPTLIGRCEISPVVSPGFGRSTASSCAGCVPSPPSTLRSGWLSPSETSAGIPAWEYSWDGSFPASPGSTPAKLEDLLTVLYTLTSFETFDSLSARHHQPDEVADEVTELMEVAIGRYQGLGQRRRRPPLVRRPPAETTSR